VDERYRKMWEKRELYELAPNRYHEVSSIASVRNYFKVLGERWKTERKWINYVDLGCGDCAGTRVFTDFLSMTTGMTVKTVGIDASAGCESSCKERGFNFIRLDLGSTPIPMQGCQVITLFETIEHIFDTDYLLSSIRDSIAEDGVLLISTLNVVCWKNRIMVPLGIQPFNTEVSLRKLSYGYRLSHLKRRMDTWKPAGHIRPFTLHSLSDMLEDNGFKVVKSYGLENWRAFKFLELVAKNMCTGIFVVARPS
jgi:SAM-dependent methyltransferase